MFKAPWKSSHREAVVIPDPPDLTLENDPCLRAYLSDALKSPYAFRMGLMPWEVNSLRYLADSSFPLEDSDRAKILELLASNWHSLKLTIF